ncbi:MAG: hypothetical protein PHU85_00265 [Phycisphaerae bacterium]|nr:hypothetical protein [Phycisphaerae bacterium]
MAFVNPLNGVSMPMGYLAALAQQAMQARARALEEANANMVGAGRAIGEGQAAGARSAAEISQRNADRASRETQAGFEQGWSGAERSKDRAAATARAAEQEAAAAARQRSAEAGSSARQERALQAEAEQNSKNRTARLGEMFGRFGAETMREQARAQTEADRQAVQDAFREREMGFEERRVKLAEGSEKNQLAQLEGDDTAVLEQVTPLIAAFQASADPEEKAKLYAAYVRFYDAALPGVQSPDLRKSMTRHAELMRSQLADRAQRTAVYPQASLGLDNKVVMAPAAKPPASRTWGQFGLDLGHTFAPTSDLLTAVGYPPRGSVAGRALYEAPAPAPALSAPQSMIYMPQFGGFIPNPAIFNRRGDLNADSTTW